MDISHMNKSLSAVEKQNEIKAKLKRAFTRIDEEKQGTVKQAIFYQILECLDVSLNFKDRNYINKLLEKNGKITFIEAIKMLQINQESMSWEVRKKGKKIEDSQGGSSKPRWKDLTIDKALKPIMGDINVSHSVSVRQSKAIASFQNDEFATVMKQTPSALGPTTTKHNYRAQSVMTGQPRPNQRSIERSSINRNENSIFTGSYGFDEQSLLQRVQNIIKKYELNHQRFNRVRFEMFREDSDETYELASSTFKLIYKRLGIKTNICDEKDIFQYFSQNSSNPRNMINLRQLNKLADVLAKQLMKQKSEEGRVIHSSGMQQFVTNNNFQWKHKQTMDIATLFDLVQGKLRRAFNNSSEAYRFFNIPMNNQVRKEHFLFCVSYFNLEFSLYDCILLFQLVDSKNDDFIDESEFCHLYGDAKVTSYMQLNDQVSQMLQIKETKMKMDDRFNKTPLNKDEIMDYPHFFKIKRNNLQLNQNKLAIKPNKRTLSILGSSSKKNLARNSKSSTPSNNFSAFYQSKRTNYNNSIDYNHDQGNITDLIQNNYMNQYVRLRQDQDRENYLDTKLVSRKPIFKNFIDNNANMRRREVQLQKMRQFKAQEKEEEDIQYNLQNQTADGFQHRTFDPEALLKNRPLKSVQRLITNYQAGGAGKSQYSNNLQSNSLSSTPAKSNFMDKLRKNKMNIQDQAASHRLGSAGLVVDLDDTMSQTSKLGFTAQHAIVDPRQLFKSKERKVMHLSKTRSVISQISNYEGD